MNRKLLVGFSFFLIALTNTPAGLSFNGKFPGKGSRKAWERAAHIYDLGVEAARSKNYVKSEQLYRTAIKGYPYDADFYFNLGVALGHQKKWNQAEPILKKAAEMNSTEFAPAGEYAAVLMELHKYNSARRVLDSASKLPKTSIELQIYKANLVELNNIRESKR